MRVATCLAPAAYSAARSRSWPPPSSATARRCWMPRAGPGRPAASTPGAARRPRSTWTTRASPTAARGAGGRADRRPRSAAYFATLPVKAMAAAMREPARRGRPKYRTAPAPTCATISCTACCTCCRRAAGARGIRAPSLLRGAGARQAGERPPCRSRPWRAASKPRHRARRLAGRPVGQAGARLLESIANADGYSPGSALAERIAGANATRFFMQLPNECDGLALRALTRLPVSTVVSIILAAILPARGVGLRRRHRRDPRERPGGCCSEGTDAQASAEPEQEPAPLTARGSDASQRVGALGVGRCGPRCPWEPRRGARASRCCRGPGAAGRRTVWPPSRPRWPKPSCRPGLPPASLARRPRDFAGLRRAGRADPASGRAEPKVLFCCDGYYYNGEVGRDAAGAHWRRRRGVAAERGSGWSWCPTWRGSRASRPRQLVPATTAAFAGP